MTTVSHGKPYAGDPHVRFEEGDSASAEPRRKSLLHNIRMLPIIVMTCFGCVSSQMVVREEGARASSVMPRKKYHIASLNYGTTYVNRVGADSGSATRATVVALESSLPEVFSQDGIPVDVMMKSSMNWEYHWSNVFWVLTLSLYPQYCRIVSKSEFMIKPADSKRSAKIVRVQDTQTFSSFWGTNFLMPFSEVGEDAEYSFRTYTTLFSSGSDIEDRGGDAQRLEALSIARALGELEVSSDGPGRRAGSCGNVLGD